MGRPQTLWKPVFRIMSGLAFATCVLLGLTFLSPGLTQAADQQALFIGNSYTFGNQPNSLQEIAGKLMEEGVPGWKQVFTKQISHGGYRWEQHRLDADGTGQNKELHDLLVLSKAPEHQWNSVILQEQSQIPGFPANEGYWIRSLQALQAMDKLIAKRGASTVLLMTWGYRNGDSRNPNMFGTYKAMQQRLRNGYREYARRSSSATRSIVVAPAGSAWEKIYDDIKSAGGDPQKDSSLFSRLYDGDGSHPSQLGSYLAGAVVYATLTGRDPTGLTHNPDGKLSATDMKTLQQAAAHAVLKTNIGVYAYPWQHSWKTYKTPSDATPRPGTIISSTTLHPLVILKEGSQNVQGLSLGTTHKTPQGTLKGDGRLLLSGTATLKVEGPLEVGVQGTGEVVQQGGTLVAEKLVLAGMADSKGSYSLLAGTLQVDQVEKGKGTGDFTMRGGILKASQILLPLKQAGGSILVDKNLLLQGDYTLFNSGTLELKAPSNTSTPLVTIDGNATLQGTLKLTGDWKQLNGKVILLKAKKLTFGSNFKIDGLSKEEQAGLKQEKDKDGQDIYTFQIVVPGREKSKEEPASDAGNIDSTVPDIKPQDNTINTEGMISDNEEDKGCCQVTDTPPAMMWIGAILFLLMWGGRPRRQN